MPPRKLLVGEVLERRLAAIPLFQQLPPEKIVHLAQRTRARWLKRGEMLFQQGDLAVSLFLVAQGQVKLSFPSANGNEKVMDIVGPNQWFGEVALLTQSPQSVFAQAVTDAMILSIPKEVVLELLEEDSAFVRRMLASLAKRTQMLIEDVETYTQRSCAQRVVSFLAHHCNRVGDSNEHVAITLPTAKHIMASRLNLTPETLSRIFHDLTEAELISVQGRRITIKDPGRLREYDA